MQSNGKSCGLHGRQWRSFEGWCNQGRTQNLSAWLVHKVPILAVKTNNVCLSCVSVLSCPFALWGLRVGLVGFKVRLTLQSEISSRQSLASSPPISAILHSLCFRAGSHQPFRTGMPLQWHHARLSSTVSLHTSSSRSISPIAISSLFH